MTSTNVNMGIEGRTSSRILKPPGGAHTDIFGSEDKNEPGSARQSKQSQKSSIMECFSYDAPANKPMKEAVNAATKNGENRVANSSPTEDENSKPAINVPTPARVRVPPGGFSSGLW